MTNPEPTNLNLLGLITTVIIASLAVIGGYILAVRQYFKQREHEQNRKRYLDEGFDALVSQIEEAFQVFRHNWAYGLHVMQNFRDLRKKTDPDICKDKFRNIDQSSFQMVSVYRIRTVINDELMLIWKIQQTAFVFVEISARLFTSDIASMIRVYLAKSDDDKFPTEEGIDEITNEYFTAIESQDIASHRFYQFLAILQDIATEFEKIERLNRSQLDSFRDNEKVKTSLEALGELFPEFIEQAD